MSSRYAPKDSPPRFRRNVRFGLSFFKERMCDLLSLSAFSLLSPLFCSPVLFFSIFHNSFRCVLRSISRTPLVGSAANALLPPDLSSHSRGGLPLFQPFNRCAEHVDPSSRRRDAFSKVQGYPESPPPPLPSPSSPSPAAVRLWRYALTFSSCRLRRNAPPSPRIFVRAEFLSYRHLPGLSVSVPLIPTVLSALTGTPSLLG